MRGGLRAAPWRNGCGFAFGDLKTVGLEQSRWAHPSQACSALLWEDNVTTREVPLFTYTMC